MAVKVFITGVTGYIGGDALYALSKKHPEWEYCALIRTQEKANRVQQQYPKLRIVLGDLDDSAVLREESAKADIVLHTADASDHEGAARAIATGIVEGHAPSKPGFWLHTGGTGILTYEDSKNNRLGEWSTKEYNDLSGVDELTHLPDEAFHRNVDKIVLEAGTKYADRVYELSKLILQKGYTPIVGAGKARWNHVHVYDLATAFVLLAEAAVAQNLSDDIWGAKGYHLCENGEHVWADLARKISAIAADKGYIPANPVEKQLSKDEALGVAGFEAVSWGLNSRGKAERLRKFLAWTPKERSIEEEAGRILEAERSRLQGKTMST
ncbi:nucleoside-diphosphate-sugar epimerase [Fonsecaea pedrosoi]|nr:nucleoside-diphosphate-sugar epimerase [Fonsecaea pedrosoi]